LVQILANPTHRPPRKENNLALEAAGAVAGQDPAIADVTLRLRQLIQAGKAKNTLRRYKADWQDFAAWRKRERHRLPFLAASPSAISLYITHLAANG